jgi:hypothetical protein
MQQSTIDNVQHKQKHNNDMQPIDTTSSPNSGNTLVGRSFSSIINKYVRNGESKFQLQYFDYEKDQWTVPVLLTASRAINFQNDASVKKVRILWRSVSFELDTF